MEKAVAGEDEIADDKAAPSSAGAPSPKRRKTAAVDAASSGAGLCDDVVGNILARLPARTAVASMALSKHHRRLICSPEFRSLHCHLGPSLPHPHIACVATAPIRRIPDQVEPVSGFVGFHVAGAGLSSSALMRSLSGRRYLNNKYVNTCNGIVLLASKYYSGYQCRFILWNPAIADVVKEVTVKTYHCRGREYLILGLGYGRRSKTYTLLLLCRTMEREGGTEFSLVTYALSDLGKLPTEVWIGRDTEISQHSLYMEGKIYLLNKKRSAILAFDVDEETVTSLGLPIEPHPDHQRGQELSNLMELSGRPCVVTNYGGGGIGVWLLSVDHQWVRRCLIGEPRWDNIWIDQIVGVWDCGDALVLNWEDDVEDVHCLFLYNVTTKEMFRASLGRDLVPESKMFRANSNRDLAPQSSGSSDYALCWGYRPTLVSPSSIVGKLKLNQDKEQCREFLTDMMKALKPVAEQDRRKGLEATLDIMCFMNFLVRIMQKLPKHLQQVLEMTMMDSDDPDISFENIPLVD